MTLVTIILICAASLAIAVVAVRLFPIKTGETSWVADVISGRRFALLTWFMFAFVILTTVFAAL
jgi:hypothetical protein